VQDAGSGLKSLAVLASVLPLSHLCWWDSYWPSWCVGPDGARLTWSSGETGWH